MVGFAATTTQEVGWVHGSSAQMAPNCALAFCHRRVHRHSRLDGFPFQDRHSTDSPRHADAFSQVRIDPARAKRSGDRRVVRSNIARWGNKDDDDGSGGRSGSGGDSVTTPPLLIRLVDGVASVLSTPTPGWNRLALGYPLFLGLSGAIFQSVATTALLVLFFTTYAFLGRKFVVEDGYDYDEGGMDNVGDDDDDDDQVSPYLTDLFAMFAALASSLLLAPSIQEAAFGIGSAAGASSNILNVISIASVVFAIVAVTVPQTDQESQSLRPSKTDDDGAHDAGTARSIDDEVMKSWDDRFNEERKTRS